MKTSTYKSCRRLEGTTCPSVIETGKRRCKECIYYLPVPRTVALKAPLKGQPHLL
jgi:hypothetical protein